MITTLKTGVPKKKAVIVVLGPVFEIMKLSSIPQQPHIVAIEATVLTITIFELGLTASQTMPRCNREACVVLTTSFVTVQKSLML